MSHNDLVAWRPLILSILRAVTGSIFLFHGTQKLLGFPPTERVIAAFSLSWYTAIIELFCGALTSSACSPGQPHSSPPG